MLVGGIGQLPEDPNQELEWISVAEIRVDHGFLRKRPRSYLPRYEYAFSGLIGLRGQLPSSGKESHGPADLENLLNLTLDAYVIASSEPRFGVPRIIRKC